MVKLGFWVFENIARDTRLVRAIVDLFFEHVQ